MFSTRLNPTKPHSAAHRLILEKVGAACRELRPIVDAAGAADRLQEHATEVFARHGVLKIGIESELGGAGTDPLLIAMAAERIGREGIGLVNAFAFYVTGVKAIWQEVEFARVLDMRLVAAGGAVGVLADCLEAAAEFVAQQIKPGEGASLSPQLARHFADTASDLEAARALTYAAAELKAEYDRHSDSDHLRLEASTLLFEAWFFAAGAVDRMLARMETIQFGGAPLEACLPPRHRLAPRDAPPFDELAQALAAEIARFYLFE